MDELYEYGCPLAESGDDYDTVMASCGKKYEVMPARYPKEMVLAALGEQMNPYTKIHSEKGVPMGAISLVKQWMPQELI